MRQDFSFNGIIHSCTQHGSQEHFDACEGSAGFGAPVITLSGSDFDEGNSGVIGPSVNQFFRMNCQRSMILFLSWRMTARPFSIPDVNITSFGALEINSIIPVCRPQFKTLSLCDSGDGKTLKTRNFIKVMSLR